MTAQRYAIVFPGDGSYTADPTPLTIIPGTTCLMHCQAKQIIEGATTVCDLTAASLAMAFVDGTGVVFLDLQDGPMIAVTNATVGLFTIDLSPILTDDLPKGAYQMELKIIYPDGTRSQLCYAPVTVGPTSIPAL